MRSDAHHVIELGGGNEMRCAHLGGAVNEESAQRPLNY
jgi:hypothetical protein